LLAHLVHTLFIMKLKLDQIQLKHNVQPANLRININNRFFSRLYADRLFLC